MWWHMNPFYFHGLGMIFNGAFWIVIILIVLKLIEKKQKPYENKSNEAMNTLRERFAKGEIDEEEFLRKKDLLSK